MIVSRALTGLRILRIERSRSSSSEESSPPRQSVEHSSSARYDRKNPRQPNAQQGLTPEGLIDLVVPLVRQTPDMLWATILHVRWRRI